jgi:hypothetical protein
MLPPNERLVDAQLDRYIRDKLYWVLHAPRQTGKTTFLQSWMREINAVNSGSDGTEPIAYYVSVESCQSIADPERVMRNIYRSILNFAQLFKVPPGSPFNIKSDSASLSNFHKDDIERIFAQRTAENGQRITVEALDYVYNQSMGQPWIVNSLFSRATMYGISLK